MEFQRSKVSPVGKLQVIVLVAKGSPNEIESNQVTHELLLEQCGVG
jgi:hypothetical protein